MKTKIIVETKKGTKQETTWKITQAHPHPDIERGSWRNGDGFFPTWRGGMSNGSMVADGIGLKFYCALLRSDLVNEEGNRADHAGYTPYDYSKTLPTNPGAITYRGRDLGEMEFKIDMNSQYIDMAGRTDGEREFITAQIVPALRAAIEAHKAELRAAALAEMEKGLADRIAKMRDDADKLEKEAAEAMKAEKARKV